jgi:hypothetical protein
MGNIFGTSCWSVQSEYDFPLKALSKEKSKTRPRSRTVSVHRYPNELHTNGSDTDDDLFDRALLDRSFRS